MIFFASLSRMRLFIFAICMIVFGLISQAGIASSFYTSLPVTGTETITPFDKRFINLMRRWRIPGASVAIMKNGKVILARGYGWADIQHRLAVQPDSLFRIGSVSKTITAVTVLKLAQEQKIRLDDGIFNILSDLTPLNHRHNPQINQITVRHLLQMSSGWSTDHIDPMFGPWSVYMMKGLNANGREIPPSCITAARLMMGMRLQFRPGTRFSYSNINYCMLGLLTNKASGTGYDYLDYQIYIQQHILAPIGITDMQIGDTLPQNRAPQEVKYYRSPGFSPDPHDIMGDLTRVDGLPYSNVQILKKNYADGGWIASSIDLAKFLQALYSNQILSPYMIHVMLEKPSYLRRHNNYFAMGWIVKRIKGRRYVFKTGSFTGTYALVMQRDDGTSYAALFNIKPPQRVQFLAQLRRVLVSA